jgi:DNA helicase HerA-like ATPase
MPSEDRNWAEGEQFEGVSETTRDREALDDQGEPQQTESPVLIVSDAGSDGGEPLPKVFDRVGQVVYWNRSPSFTEISVRLEVDAEVRPGQFLGVWHGPRGRSVLTVFQVADCFEVNPNEVPDLAAARAALDLGRGYGKEGISTRIFRLAEGATLEEFDVRVTDVTWELDGEGRAAETLVRAGDPVVLLSEKATIQVIGGRPDPNDGVNLGETYGSAPVPITLTPEMLQMHILVCGNPGKGKSYLAGNILEEAWAWGIPSLVLDINGEMIRAAESLGGLVITLPDAEKFGISLNSMTPAELVAVTPNVQPGTIYAELIELAHDQLKNEARGKPITFQELKDRIQKIGEDTKAKTSIGAAIARISALEHDPIIGKNFDFEEELKKHRLVVLDCRFLSLRQTQLIAAAGARELQRVGREAAGKLEQHTDNVEIHKRNADSGNIAAIKWMQKYNEAHKWFSLYFVDEAHAVVPQDDKVVSTQVFYELARMGRHVRTGLVLSSQSPQDLNPSVLKRLQTRFIFALEKDQLRSIQGVTADLDEKIVNQLPKLPRSVCAVSGAGELIRHGFLLKVRQRTTPVGGRTPKVFEGRRKKPKAAHSEKTGVDTK